MNMRILFPVTKGLYLIVAEGLCFTYYSYLILIADFFFNICVYPVLMYLGI